MDTQKISDIIEAYEKEKYKEGVKPEHTERQIASFDRNGKSIEVALVKDRESDIYIRIEPEGYLASSLNDVLPDDKRHGIMRQIKETVSEFYGVSPDEVRIKKSDESTENILYYDLEVS